MQKIVFTDSQLGRYQVDRENITLAVLITAGVPTIIGTAKPKILIEKGLAGSQVELTQANIDDLLGVADDVDAATAFGSTAMVANDTLGFVLACEGQVESVDVARMYVAGASALSLVEDVTTLPDSAFTGLEVLVTPAGNIVARYDELNITAAGSNVVVLLEIYTRLK